MDGQEDDDVERHAKAVDELAALFRARLSRKIGEGEPITRELLQRIHAEMVGTLETLEMPPLSVTCKADGPGKVKVFVRFGDPEEENY